MAALDPEIRGADRVREVFARVAAGDASVADLYAEDAVVNYGAQGKVEGREAIRAFYRATIERVHPQPRVEAVVEDPPLYVALIDVPTDDGHMRTLDLFDVDDEGIRSLEIYVRH
jgi:hypothetical protein